MKEKKQMSEAEWYMLLTAFGAIWFLMFLRYWNG
jgi:hypothetical protein